MARILIQQPDKKLAVFSTIMDQFVITDATLDQIIEEESKELLLTYRQHRLDDLALLKSRKPFEVQADYNNCLKLHNMNCTPNNIIS